MLPSRPMGSPAMPGEGPGGSQSLRGSHTKGMASARSQEIAADAVDLYHRPVKAALLPLLREGALERGFADVIAVTSTAGQRAYEGGGGYAASKFGLRALMDTLRLELAGEPIRVMQVAPGMVRTDEFTLHRLGGDAERAAALYEGVEHPLTADDVALVIAQSLALPGHINLDEITMRPVAQAAQHKLIRGPLRPREAPRE